MTDAHDRLIDPRLWPEQAALWNAMRDWIRSDNPANVTLPEFHALIAKAIALGAEEARDSAWCDRHAALAATGKENLLNGCTCHDPPYPRLGAHWADCPAATGKEVKHD